MSSSATSAPAQAALLVQSSLLQKVNFTAQYKKAGVFIDNFKLPQGIFGKCGSIQWWAGWHAQIPNLSQLAQGILLVPGGIFFFTYLLAPISHLLCPSGT